MNGMDVSPDIPERLSAGGKALTPEARKAARYVLENPQDVGVSTVRQIAEAAKVKPSTVVRMARQAGFDGYEDFRQPFREAIRQGRASFPERARWLQTLKAEGALGELLADSAATCLRNIEESFARLSVESLNAAAKTIWEARDVFVLGVGVNAANARNFAYLARTGMNSFHAIPREGSNSADDLARADGRDALIAMTMRPFRSEVVEAVEIAREQGVAQIGISDSPASPVVLGADHGFVLSVDTPQFFPSSVATVAVLETLLSFVIAEGSGEIVERVERFHARRRRLGLYRDEESKP